MLYNIDNFNLFRDACHTASLNAGWWDKSERYTQNQPTVPDPDRLTIPTKLCLIHSEISEMYDGYTSGADDEHLPEYPNAAVEGGDVLIRIGDTAGYLNIDLTAAVHMVQQADHLDVLVHNPAASNLHYIYPATVHQLFNKLHGWTSDAMEGYRKSKPGRPVMDKVIQTLPAFDAGLARVVILTDMIARKNEWNLPAIAEAKMKFNAIRPDHKLEARQGANGKTF